MSENFCSQEIKSTKTRLCFTGAVMDLKFVSNTFCNLSNFSLVGKGFKAAVAPRGQVWASISTGRGIASDAPMGSDSEMCGRLAYLIGCKQPPMTYQLR